MRNRNATAYRFLTPYLMIFAVFWVWPIISSFLISFQATRTVPWRFAPAFNWGRLIGDALTFVSVEFGTLPPAGMQRALAQDHWLHNRGAVDWNDAETRRIKLEMYEAYCPRHDDWREMVMDRCRQVTRQAIEGLQRDN